MPINKAVALVNISISKSKINVLKSYYIVSVLIDNMLSFSTTSGPISNDGWFSEHGSENTNYKYRIRTLHIV
jgi:hypothetical protein